MLEHLFRGCSLVWGMREGVRREGCRGEGDLLG